MAALVLAAAIVRLIAMFRRNRRQVAINAPEGRLRSAMASRGRDQACPSRGRDGACPRDAMWSAICSWPIFRGII
jgi:hypothetical protein